MQLTPTILTDSKADLLHKVNFLQGKTSWVQIDFVDQAFAGKVTVRPEQIESWPNLQTKLECHLMVANPFGWVRGCDQLLPQRLVAQVEAVKSQIEFVERVVSEGMEVGFALNLQTPLQKLEKAAVFNARIILVLGVLAGQSGQKFHPEVITKIKELQILRQQLGANFQIGLDGGVKPDFFPILQREGVDIAYVNSALWSAADWQKRLRQLQARAKGSAAAGNSSEG